MSDASTTDARAPSSDGGRDDGGSLDGGTLDGGPRTPPPGDVAFVDHQLARGLASGEVTVARASDESLVEYYELVWLDAAGATIGEPIASIARTTEPIAHALADAAVPESAVEIAALAVGPRGRSEPGASALADNYVRHVDVGGALGRDQVYSAVLAPVLGSNVVFFVAVDAGERLSIRRCTTDGLDCEEQASFGDRFNAHTVAAKLVGARLYVSVSRSTRLPGESPGHLYVCPIEGESLGACELHALELAPTGGLAFNSHAAYVALDGFEGNPRVAQCPLPAPTAESPCVIHDVSAEAPDHSGRSPFVAADEEGLYLAGYDGTHTGLFSCPLDESGTPSDCAYTSSALGWPIAMERADSLVVIAADGGDLSWCTAAAGRVSNCGSGNPGNVQTYGTAVSGHSLRVSAQSSEGSDALMTCELSELGVGSCTSSFAPGRGRIAELATGDVLIGSTGTPRLTRCVPGAAGAPYTCTDHDASTDPPGFHGMPHGLDVRGERLVALTRSEQFPITILVSCGLDRYGMITSCAQAELAISESLDLAPRLSAEHVHFAGIDGEGRAMVRSCTIGAGPTLEGCVNHTVGTERTFVPALYLAGDELFLASNLRDSDTVVASTCTLDASGAPVDCADTRIDDAPREDLGVRGNARALYVVRHEFPDLVVYACPRTDSGLAECARTNAGSSMRGGFDVAVTDGHLYTIGLAADTTPLLTHCALAADGTVESCAPVDLASLALRFGRSPRIAVRDGRIYLGGVRFLSGRPTLVACDLDAEGAPVSCAVDDLDDETAGHEEQFAFGTGSGSYLLTPDPRNRMRPGLFAFQSF